MLTVAGEPLSRAQQATNAGAAGQSQPPVLQEVVVTAQKRVERLQDVPVAVTAVQADALAEAGKARLADYFAEVPGLSLNSPNVGGQQQVIIRGITTGVNGNATVGVTVDDVPYGSTTILGFGDKLVPDIDPYDLQRVEVLKGPQGTLYGASSIGGLLKFVTIDPSIDGLSGHLQGDINDVENAGKPGYAVRGAVNVPVTDTLAFRASGFTRTDAGYVDDLETGQKDINKVVVDGGRVSALWRPSDIFSLKLSALLQDTKGHGADYTDANSRLQPTMGDLNQTTLRGTEGYDLKVRLYSATGTAHLGGVDLTAVSAYGTNAYTQISDISLGLAPLLGVPGLGLGQTFDTKKYTEELRASSSIGTSLQWLSRLDWLLGGFYTHEQTQAVQYFDIIDTSGTVLPPQLLNIIFPTTYAEWAAFADVTLHFTDRFDLQLGGRESQNRQIYDELDVGPLVPALLGFPTPYTVPTVHSKDNSFTYLLTPRFRISPDMMVYARIASGYRPGGPNTEIAALGNATRVYKPDKTVDYELGFKADLFDRMLSLDASVYSIDWKDIQISVTSPSGAVYFTNGTKAKSQGAELSLQARPIQGLTLSTALSFSDAKLQDDLPPGSAVGHSGDRLPNSARFTGSVSAQQEFSLTSAARGFVGGTVSYIGDRKGEFAAAPPFVRLDYPGFTQLDLRTGIHISAWTLTVYANNVTDKRGILGGRDPILGSGLATDPYFVSYIRPRTVGLTANWAF